MIGKICGTGSYVPEEYLDNDDLSQMVDTSDAWILLTNIFLMIYFDYQNTLE